MDVCIVGTSRSGSTLVRELLHESGGLALFNETHWLPRMYEHVGGQRVDWRILCDIAEKTGWDSGTDLFTVNCAFTSFLDRDALLRAFHAALAERGRVTIQEWSRSFAETCFGAGARWGDKTPDYGYYMGLIQQLWPDCRFVHVVRDGLATARSMSLHSGCQLMVSAGYDNWCWLSYDRLYQRYVRSPQPLSAYVASWRRRLERIRDEATRLRPGTYHEVRYADLVQSPAPVLSRLAAWLELEPEVGWIERASRIVRPPRPAEQAPPELLAQLSDDDRRCLEREA